MIITNLIVYADEDRKCLGAANLETGLVVYDYELDSLKFEAIHSHRAGHRGDGWPVETTKMDRWMGFLQRCDSMGVESDKDGNLYEFWKLK